MKFIVEDNEIDCRR